MRRMKVNKSRARRDFNRRAQKTAAMNMTSPRRGGWRL